MYSSISLYFSDSTELDARIYELNPEHGTICHRISVPAGAVDGLAFFGDDRCSISFLDDLVYKLDERTGTILDAPSPRRDLVKGFGAVGG